MRALVEKARERISVLERQREDMDATLTELREIEQAASRHLETTESTRVAVEAEIP